MLKRFNDRGMSLIELMVVVVIIGVLAAVAMPYFGRDRKAREGSEFARELARDLQRARSQAVAERLPIRAFIYSDRVVFISYTIGVTPAAAPTAPTTTTVPVLRTLMARPGIAVWNVLNASATPPGAITLNTSSALVQMDFNTLGQMVLVSTPALPTPPALTPAFIYVRNGNVPANHPDRDYRIDVTALSGFVTQQLIWN
jgi:type IV fimbrial biogenesis protein FimT